MQLLTTVSGKSVSVELLGQDHGSPTEVGSIFVNRLAKGELGDSLVSLIIHRLASSLALL